MNNSFMRNSIRKIPNYEIEDTFLIEDINTNEESKFSYFGWLVVAMVGIANLIGYGLVYAFSIFFKPLASEFGWTRAITAGAFSVYTITHNIFSPFAGAISDKFGPKTIAALGGFCLGISMILMSRITTVWELYLYYALFLGFGMAAIYGPLMTTVSQCFNSKRGVAMGLAATGGGVGFMLMPPVIGWLVASCGWRAAYFFTGVITIIIFFPITIFIKRPPKQSTLPRTSGEFYKNFSFMDALKTRSLWMYCFSFFFISMAFWTIIVHIIPLFTDKGISIKQASLLAGFIGGASIVGRISGGLFSDKMGRRKILLIGYILQMMAFVSLFFTKEIWMFFVFAIAFGLSNGIWISVIAAFPADYFGLKATGSIFGFVLAISGIGGAIGSYTGGYFFDVTHSYNFMILICFFATVFAIFITLFLKPPKPVYPMGKRDPSG